MKGRILPSPEGNIPQLCLSELSDVGRFTTTACFLRKSAWKEDFNLVSETIRMDEAVRAIEKMYKQKMEASYRPYKQIVEEETKETDEWPNRFWLQAEVVHAFFGPEKAIACAEQSGASDRADVGGGVSQEVLVASIPLRA
ncbi:hypothetical protein E8E12_011347 [Didymella heteroderae]|uniref:Uncharacterized protein n=1 Tax=Didymella heteroderae TaxID=1769908 RepID=A0A9P4WZ80_9PLEO|nr:hypothetical protein E8E12_011347 [Didymella heteroderae]